MTEAMKVCRLCMKTGEDFEVFTDSERDIIKIVISQKDLNISNQDVICTDCTKIIQQSFSFKSKCLEIEDSIHDFKTDDKQVNLEKILGIAPDNTAEPIRVCRTCLGYLENKVFIDINVEGSLWKPIFRKSLPEIDIELTIKPVICQTCKELITKIHNFNTICMNTEEKIKTYLENIGENTNFNLYDVVRYEMNKNILPDVNRSLESEQIIKDDLEEDCEIVKDDSDEDCEIIETNVDDNISIIPDSGERRSSRRRKQVCYRSADSDSDPDYCVNYNEDVSDSSDDEAYSTPPPKRARTIIQRPVYVNKKVPIAKTTANAVMCQFCRYVTSNEQAALQHIFNCPRAPRVPRAPSAAAQGRPLVLILNNTPPQGSLRQILNSPLQNQIINIPNATNTVIRNPIDLSKTTNTAVPNLIDLTNTTNTAVPNLIDLTNTAVPNLIDLTNTTSTAVPDLIDVTNATRELDLTGNVPEKENVTEKEVASSTNAAESENMTDMEASKNTANAEKINLPEVEGERQTETVGQANLLESEAERNEEIVQIEDSGLTEVEVTKNTAETITLEKQTEKADCRESVTAESIVVDDESLDGVDQEEAVKTDLKATDINWFSLKKDIAGDEVTLLLKQAVENNQKEVCPKLSVMICNTCDFNSRSSLKMALHCSMHLNNRKKTVNYVGDYRTVDWCMNCMKMYDKIEDLQSHLEICTSKPDDKVFLMRLGQVMHCTKCYFDSKEKDLVFQHILNCGKIGLNGKPLPKE